MISDKFVLICNRLHDIQANRGKITTFRGYPSLTFACAGLCERRVSGLIKASKKLKKTEKDETDSEK